MRLPSFYSVVVSSLSVTLAICIFARVLGGLSSFDNYLLAGSVAIMLLFFFFSLINDTKIRINGSIAAFLSYIVINIIINRIPPQYNIWMRYGLFFILLSVLGPFFQNKTLRVFRTRVLSIIIWLAIVFSTLSFFAYFLGINMFYRYGEYITEYEGSAGRFSGLFTHSMLLGSIAGLSSVVLVNKLFTNKKGKRAIVFFLLVACVGSTMFAASRASFLSMLMGQAVVMFIHSKKRSSLIRTVFLSLVIIVLSYPLWNYAMTGLEQKQMIHSDIGIYDSRTEKVLNRSQEFLDNPIVGIGFQTVSMYSSDAPDSSGHIEPGSSWLCILSMTGIIGFVLFLSIWSQSFHFTKRIKDVNASAVLYGLLVFFSIHLLVEGYIFAAGSFLCILCWLIVGVCIDEKYRQEPVLISAF